ncbi:ExbD/TolR family protein [Marinobacter sp. JSM 1782161]|uniref:ExbD/TolR family protein n=1 Tax=Marinobacter sp. JSM 1782161 TaxID=2685906 RepID=UPI0014036475|nr:biopolymer transporter ExbD [Marinobacter sp. JSM 1782161]
MQLVDPRPRRRLPIRMTPLIDVVFILLVFFMVTSRLAPTSHLDLDNRTGTSGGGEEGEPLPELVMEADGRIQWDERTLSATSLADALLRAGEREVNLETEGDVPLGTFTAGLTRLQSAGINTHWRRTSQSDTDVNDPQ